MAFKSFYLIFFVIFVLRRYELTQFRPIFLSMSPWKYQEKYAEKKWSEGRTMLSEIKFCIEKEF